MLWIKNDATFGWTDVDCVLLTVACTDSAIMCHYFMDLPLKTSSLLLLWPRFILLQPEFEEANQSH
jgi:hypothetical protein